MKISIGQEFKHIISALNEIINSNLIFECKKSGLYCMAPDDATVCLIEVFLHKDTMSVYDIENNVGQLISVDMNLLYKIMKTIKYDTLHLELFNNTNTLMISSEGERKCKFELPLLDTMKEDMVIPEIDYDCSFTINKSNFQGICKDLKQFGEVIVLKVDNNKVFFSTKDEIECNIELEIHVDNEDNNSLEKKYDLQYFLKMLKASALSSDVSFYFSKNMPLVVEYKLEDGESYIRYYLGNMI